LSTEKRQRLQSYGQELEESGTSGTLHESKARVRDRRRATQIIEIPGQIREHKVLINLSLTLRSTNFQSLTMSDAASRDDQTSVRSASQMEKMEKTERGEDMEKTEERGDKESVGGAVASVTVAPAAPIPVATGAAPPATAAAYPSTQKRILIMTALYLAVFLVTLVRFAPFK
jgi:hypothetical protein